MFGLDHCKTGLGLTSSIFGSVELPSRIRAARFGITRFPPACFHLFKAIIDYFLSDYGPWRMEDVYQGVIVFLRRRRKATSTKESSEIGDSILQVAFSSYLSSVFSSYESHPLAGIPEYQNCTYGP